MRTSGLLLAVLLLASCGADDESWSTYRSPEVDGAFVASVTRGETTLVRYLDGTEVEIPSKPVRVVSTVPGLTRTMADLGLFDRLVAISPWCEAAAGSPEPRRLSVMPLDRETLTAVAPDLILVDGVVHSPGIGRLGRGDPPVLRLESRSVAHLIASADLLASVFEAPEVGARRDRMCESLANSLGLTQPPAEPPLRVLIVAEPQPLFVLGPGSLLDDVLRSCGCVNVASDLGRASGSFSRELALAREPELVLAIACEPPDVGTTRLRLDGDQWSQASIPTACECLLRLTPIVRDAVRSRAR